MYGYLQVLEDSRPVGLLFMDKKSAEHFAAFVAIYIAESGAGNGYGAYWHFRDNPIIGVDEKMGQGSLNLDLIMTMARSICRARMARPGTWGGETVPPPEYAPEMGSVGGAILFNFDAKKFPPRLLPKAGDLVTIVDCPKYERSIARAKEVVGENVILTPCLSSGIKEDTTFPIVQTMKIHDFLNGE